MGKGGDAAVGSLRKRTDQIKQLPKFTWKDVKEHAIPSDAWIVYLNKVYDVSNWHDHPGGAVVFTHAGDDATDIFAAFHAPGSQNLLRKFLIGDLIVESIEHKDAHQHAFEKAYRDLRSQLIVMGMFKSNFWFYVYKQFSLMAMWASAFALMNISDNGLFHIAAGLLMGLFFQQCGWLAHDFLHHQVYKKRRHGDYSGLFWGGVAQGFSAQWWKNKHNGHHAVPNLLNSSETSQDGDPDIDTMPLLAWSVEQAQSSNSTVVKFMIRNQKYFYFPILLVARLSWLNESFKYAYGLGAASENAKLERDQKGLQYPFLEKATLLVHYVWVAAFVSGFGRFAPLYSFGLFMLITCSCGLFLAIVFGLGHSGMEVYNAETRPDFWKLQVTTSRNLIGGHGIPQWFVDWFCGGLQYQVDHHLFPMIPRHNLAKTHGLVKSFCKEWKVNYHEADLVDGTREVLQCLDSVAMDFVVEFVQDGPTM